MKNTLHTLGNIFLTFLVIILVVYFWIFIEIKLLLKPQPGLFGYVFYQETVEDMSPEFEINDIIIVKKDAPFQSGDIILYFDSNDSLYKTHYVVTTGEKETITKCASCDTNNPAIKNENIVGKAIGKVVFMGSIISFFKKKSVLIIIGVLGISFLTVSQYIELKPKKEVENKPIN